MKKIKIVSFRGITLKDLRRKKDLVNPEIDNPYYFVFDQLEKKFIILDDNSEEKADIVLYFDFDIKEIFKNRNSLNIYFAFEPEIVDSNHSKEKMIKYLNYFDYIMTWNDNIVDNELFFKINWMYKTNKNTEVPVKKFNEKKLLVNFSGNKSSKNNKELYSERKKVIDFFEKNHSDEFEFYGPGWRELDYKTYKGKVDSKSPVYSRFKFALCLENMEATKGYITEKIFDCFYSGVVPIYSGGNDEYISKKSYINYFDFTSLQDLYNYLDEMDEQTYNEYILEGKKIINSDVMFFFSEKNFIENLEKVLIKNKRVTNNYKIFLKKLESLFWIKKNYRKLRKRIKKYLRGEKI